jgi:hypothetical protein
MSERVSTARSKTGVSSGDVYSGPIGIAAVKYSHAASFDVLTLAGLDG